VAHRTGHDLTITSHKENAVYFRPLLELPDSGFSIRSHSHANRSQALDETHFISGDYIHAHATASCDASQVFPLQRGAVDKFFEIRFAAGPDTGVKGISFCDTPPRGSRGDLRGRAPKVMPANDQSMLAGRLLRFRSRKVPEYLQAVFIPADAMDHRILHAADLTVARPSWLRVRRAACPPMNGWRQRCHPNPHAGSVRYVAWASCLRVLAAALPPVSVAASSARPPCPALTL